VCADDALYAELLHARRQRQAQTVDAPPPPARSCIPPLRLRKPAAAAHPTAANTQDDELKRYVFRAAVMHASAAFLGAT
jgi:hypothetical protein